METIKVPAGSVLARQTLAELAPTKKTGVQIAGINRHGLRILNPGGDEKLFEQDEVLLLGSAEQIRAFTAWAAEQATVTGE